MKLFKTNLEYCRLKSEMKEKKETGVIVPSSKMRELLKNLSEKKYKITIVNSSTNEKINFQLAANTFIKAHEYTVEVDGIYTGGFYSFIKNDIERGKGIKKVQINMLFDVYGYKANDYIMLAKLKKETEK